MILIIVKKEVKGTVGSLMNTFILDIRSIIIQYICYDVQYCVDMIKRGHAVEMRRLLAKDTEMPLVCFDYNTDMDNQKDGFHYVGQLFRYCIIDCHARLAESLITNMPKLLHYLYRTSGDQDQGNLLSSCCSNLYKKIMKIVIPMHTAQQLIHSLWYCMIQNFREPFHVILEHIDDLSHSDIEYLRMMHSKQCFATNQEQHATILYFHWIQKKFPHIYIINLSRWT